MTDTRNIEVQVTTEDLQRQVLRWEKKARAAARQSEEYSKQAQHYRELAERAAALEGVITMIGRIGR